MKHLRVFAITLLSFSSIALTSQTNQSQLGRGDEWLSWHSEQRQGYIWGYVDGNMEGTYTSCALADQLYETDKSHSIGHTPSARCLERRGDFSKLLSDIKFDKDGHLDVRIYTDVITEFYEKHGNCRGYPFSLLMKQLSFKYWTADELYEAASHDRLESGRKFCDFGDVPAKK